MVTLDEIITTIKTVCKANEMADCSRDMILDCAMRMCISCRISEERKGSSSSGSSDVMATDKQKATMTKLGIEIQANTITKKGASDLIGKKIASFNN